jgi:hypothetical protein
MRCRTSPGYSFALVFSGFLAAILPIMVPAAHAQKPPEKREASTLSAEVNDLLGRMSKTLLAKEFSFEARTLRAYAGTNGELLHIAHKTETVVRRPNKLVVDVTGDDGATKLFYDGTSLIIYGADRKEYASISAPNTLDEMIGVAAASLGLDLPLADFLSSDPKEALLIGVTSGGDVGTATIDGVRCRHLFFIQSPDLEMELWLEDNDRALPRRLIVTYQTLPGRPRYIGELSNWEFGTQHPDTEFVFQPPAGVTQVELATGTSSPPSAPAK